MRYFLFLTHFLVVSASDKFYNYMVDYGKNYSDAYELTSREKIFRNNDEKINTHNLLYEQGHVSYKLGHNKYSDLTFDEFNELLKGLVMPVYLRPSDRQFTAYKKTLPSAYDWRTKGVVAPVKDQDKCASSYAFATIGAIESYMMLWNNKTNLVLSEQEVIDCSVSLGNNGCHGGFTTNAYEHFIKSGVVTESDYPYTAQEQECAINKNHVKGKVTMWKGVPAQHNETLLKDAIYNIGPLAIAIDTTSWTFQFYSSGIYTNNLCSSSELDHAALLVGYGTENNKDYWIVKNSWGTTWGEEGYIRIGRNLKNQCGVATLASYPIVV